jgi:Domain of unknown function (DUF4388)
VQFGQDASENPLDVLAILDTLGLRRRTGRLLAISCGETFAFFLDRGRMVMASSSWTNLRLGRTLIRRGALRNDRLEHSLVMQTTLADQPAIGTILVENGVLSREELALAIEDQCVSVLARTLELQGATFLFDGVEPAPRQIELVHLDTNHIVDEAINQIDVQRQHQMMRRLMPSPTARLELSTAISDVALDLNDDELSVALAINRRSPTMLDLIQNFDFDLVRLQRALIRLRERGLLVAIEETR